MPGACHAAPRREEQRASCHEAHATPRGACHARGTAKCVLASLPGESRPGVSARGTRACPARPALQRT
eukprot:361500-Chlamydomonas_euryale.AAC.8